MNTPRISVVMAVHNGGVYLRPAVQSICSQTFPDFEFIIVNDGSTDQTDEELATLAAQDSRLRIFRQAKSGTIPAVNFGISMARAEFIARMDADDIAVTDRFERQLAYFEKHPEIELLGGHHEYMTEDGPSGVVVKFEQSSERIHNRIPHVNQFSQPTTMFRRETVNKLGGYRKAFLHCEDYDLWLRFVDRYPTANLDRVLLHYRIHERQTSQRFLVQQAVSFLGASLASKHRRRGLADPLTNDACVSIERLQELGVKRTAIYRKVIDKQAHGAVIWDCLQRPQAANACREATRKLGAEYGMSSYARARLLLDEGVLRSLTGWSPYGLSQILLACALRPGLTRYVVDSVVSRLRRYGWRNAWST